MKNFFSLKAYLKFLERNKLFAFINVMGFALSMAFVILLGIYLKHEFSIDKFHAKGDRIFRYETDGGIYVAPKIAEDLKNRYPEIEEIVRIKGGEYTLTDKDDSKIKVKGLWADSSFFDVFSFRLIAGDPRNVMKTKTDVILTESFARRIFGSAEAAMERDIVLDERHYMVSGVTADFERTHFNNPDVIMRYEEIRHNWGDEILTGYDNNSFYMYFLIRENADFAAKLPDVVEFFKGYYWLFKWGNCNEVILTPVDQVYKSSNGAEYMSQGKSTVFMGILVITIIIILLFAVINYIRVC